MLFSFQVYTLHLGIYALFISGIHFAFGYNSTLVYTFHLGILFSFWYTLFIWVCSFHLGMHFAFEYACWYTLFIWVYALFIWVYTFHLSMHAGIHSSFGYALFIWVYTFHLSMHALSFWYTLFIWVCSFHLGIHFSFGYANTLQRATQLCLHRTTPSEHDFLNNAHPSGRAKRSQQSVPFSIFLL